MSKIEEVRSAMVSADEGRGQGDEGVLITAFICAEE